MKRLFGFAAAILMAHPALADTDEQLLELLKSGNHFAMMRHALAPGTGDPEAFSLGNCTTQRNLNDQGRTQAMTSGQYFLERGIRFDRVYSSQWCRCLDTATLFNHGPVVELPQLNSFFESMELAESRTEQLRAWLQHLTIDRPLLLVTHQVNISALTGLYASSGEVIIVELTDNGLINAKGRISPSSD